MINARTMTNQQKNAVLLIARNATRQKKGFAVSAEISSQIQNISIIRVGGRCETTIN